MVMKTLIEKPNVKILTEKILLLLNRGGELWESCHLLTFQHHFTTSFLYILKMKGIFPYLQSTLKLLPRFYRVVVWCYRLYAWTLVFEIIHFSHLWNTMVTLCHERDLSQRWSRMDCTKWLHTVAQNETKSPKRRFHFCAFAKWTAWWWNMLCWSFFDELPQINEPFCVSCAFPAQMTLCVCSSTNPLLPTQCSNSFRMCSPAGSLPRSSTAPTWWWWLTSVSVSSQTFQTETRWDHTPNHRQFNKCWCTTSDIHTDTATEAMSEQLMIAVLLCYEVYVSSHHEVAIFMILLVCVVHLNHVLNHPSVFSTCSLMCSWGWSTSLSCMPSCGPPTTWSTSTAWTTCSQRCRGSWGRRRTRWGAPSGRWTSSSCSRSTKSSPRSLRASAEARGDWRHTASDGRQSKLQSVPPRGESWREPPKTVFPLEPYQLRDLPNRNVSNKLILWSCSLDWCNDLAKSHFQVKMCLIKNNEFAHHIYWYCGIECFELLTVRLRETCKVYNSFV